MPALAMLSPIKEAEELSPYCSSFRHGRYQTQKSPVTKTPVYYVREAAMPSPVSGEHTMDDLWIYDCYVAEDATSPGEYPRSPSSPAASHSRSVSLPSTTASYSPVITVPIVQEPTPVNSEVAPNASYAAQPASRYNVTEASEEETAYGPFPVITTSVGSPGTSAEYPEYSPLEQEAIPIWEVIDQLADSADRFAGLETLLSEAGSAESPPGIDGDVAFWIAEGLNMLVGDYTEVARELLEFNEFVEQMLAQDQQALASRPAATVRHASFSEQDSKEVLAQAAKLSSVEVQKELAALEASTPRSGRNGKRQSRERPPSLKLSTDDAVLLQAIRPRSRLQSVGALNRFSDDESQSRLEMLRKHRVYAVYGEETPVDDNCSIRSIVDYDAIEPMDEVQDAAAPGAPRPRPTSGQSMMPRPLSSPVTFAGAGRSAGRRPPSLTLTDPNIEQASQHSVSSSVSSLFSSLPRSSVTADSSPRSSPRQSLFDSKGDKQRFPTASGNIKKMFSNLFKKRESARSSMRPFAKRTGAPGSVDATLSALSLSGPTSNSSTPPPLGLGTEVDPFAASPPPPLRTPPPNQAHTRSASEASPLDGYSSLFNPVKAASKYPPQPLFGEPTP
ncbi:hypothetical protein BN946_scf184969.g17 [Trametes cinnabarina]|uniref:Uncharacterized protein n=1 Tax=Pycnoporus cinnabarinus TaxID=5643 RepID=A0A060SU47_PYCCI|nr:hypothetical protein BN946_scf184969.g17 [Trametes cinnabarina]